MSIIRNCPGADRMKGAPEITLVHCKSCGEALELFSSDESAVCPKCGAVNENPIRRSAVFKGDAK